MRRMEKIDRAAAWFHDSFEADRWSTAAAVLRLRDELVEAGWSAGRCSIASSRFAALNALEALDEPPLPPGRPDRLHAVHAELAGFGALGGDGAPADDVSTVLDIERITVIDREDVVAPAWRALFDRLARLGVAVEFEPVGRGPDVAADVVYELLCAADEWEAAETVATWLGAAGQENAAVTILCESDSAVLDSALRSRGLPVIGRATASPWHEALQLLPLLFANVWKPVDVKRLAELLSFEYCPIPRWAASRLLDALAAEPGVGGRAWDKALDRITEQGRSYRETKGEADADEKAGREAHEMQRLLVERRFDPLEGVPPDAVAEICALVVKRLSPKMASDPAAGAAVGHARLLARLCEQHERIPRIVLERMIDSIIADGITPAGIRAEAAPWRVVSHPGEVVDPAGTVVWWNFTDPGTPHSSRWSKAERDAAAAEGIELVRPETEFLREAYAWQRPAAAVAAPGAAPGAASGVAPGASRLIMVFPQVMHGEELRAHPWLDELTAAVPADTLVRTNARELFRRAEFAFAGRRVSMKQVNRRSRTPPDGRNRIGKNTIARPEKLSYSSLSELLGCPMKWALAGRAGLERPAVASIPAGNTMLGTLCHRIVELIYSGGAQRIDPEHAGKRAGELFDSLLESMASELLLAGREVERRRARETTVRAVHRLASMLEKLGLVVDSTERWLHADVDGVDMRGPIDLIARDKKGRAFIVDMKWTGSARYRREEIERGEALQLAVYCRLVRGTETTPPVGAAFFMLAQGEMLSASPLLGSDALESELDETEILHRALKSWNERLKEINGGLLDATGVTQRDEQRDDLRERYRERGGFYQQPPCHFCDFGWLCGRESDTV